MQDATLFRTACLVTALAAVLLIFPVIGIAEETKAADDTAATDTGGEMEKSKTTAAAAQTGEFAADVERKIEEAVDAFQSAIQDEKAIPRNVIANAKAVAIFPQLTKAGLLVGGRFGEGVMMIKDQDDWKGPLLVNLYGASVGAQIGIEQTDVFMFFNTEQSLATFKEGKLTLGAETSVAAGDWGEKAGTTTEADVVSYKRTEGLFAGASLSGAILEVDQQRNEQFYNQEGRPRAYFGEEETLSGENVPRSDVADELIDLLRD